MRANEKKYILLKMSTPTGKAREEKRGEEIFTYKFNRDVKKMIEMGKLHESFDLVFEDSNGAKSDVIKNVSRMRLLTDKSKPKIITPDSVFSPMKNEELRDSGEKKSKADVVLTDSNGKDVAWISHKYHKDSQGKVVDSHAQYMHGATNKKFDKKFKNGRMDEAYAELQTFKRKMLKLSLQLTSDPTKLCWPVRTDGIALSLWEPIKSKDLMGIAIFGVMYGDKNYGRQNCNVLLYGDPKITLDPENKNTVILTSSKNSLINGHIPDVFKDDGDTPIFMTLNAAATTTTVKIGEKTYKIKGVNIWIVYKGKKSSNSININDTDEYMKVLSNDKCFTGREKSDKKPMKNKIINKNSITKLESKKATLQLTSNRPPFKPLSINPINKGNKPMFPRSSPPRLPNINSRNKVHQSKLTSYMKPVSSLNTSANKKISPIKISPKKISPKKISPKKISPIKISPIKISPIKISPIKISPKKISPIKISPIKISPKKLPPVQQRATQMPILISENKMKRLENLKKRIAARK
jgi:hypothetical protein